MEIILSNNVKHLSGSLDQGLGYVVSPQKDAEGNIRFFSQRSAHGAPKDGHLKFIFACAVLARMGAHLSDIRVTVSELDEAIGEATDGTMRTPFTLSTFVLNAEEVLTLKEMLRL